MTRKTHQCFALLTTGTVCLSIRHIDPSAMNTVQCLVATGVSMYAALLPDFDTQNSYISNTGWGIIFIPVWILQGIIKLLSFLPGPFQSKLKELAKHTGHRGFSHYPFTWLIFFLLVWVLMTPIEKAWGIPFEIIKSVRLGAVCGIFSHIIGDVVFGGVAVLFPFSKRRIQLSPFKTASFVEDLSFLCLLILDVFVYRCIFLG